MPRIDGVVAVLLIAGSVGLWNAAERFPGTAGIFPRVILAALGVLAAVLLIQTLIRSSRGDSNHEGASGSRAMLRPLAAFALAVGAVFLMRASGFFLAMIAFSGALFPLLGVEKRRLYLLTLVILLTFVYVVFTLLLGVPLTVSPVAES